MKRNETGPYNRCDYRCDLCAETDDCRVFRAQQLRRITRALEGCDPDGPESFVEELSESLESAQSMLERIAKERGIDLDDALEEGGEAHARTMEELRGHPLYRRAMDTAVGCMDFARDCEESVCITPEIRPLFDEIVWYAPLVAAKTMRALTNLEAGPEAADDVSASAEVAIRSLTKCREAMERIAVYRPKTSKRSAPLLVLIEGLAEGLKEAFGVR